MDTLYVAGNIGKRNSSKRSSVLRNILRLLAVFTILCLLLFPTLPALATPEVYESHTTGDDGDIEAYGVNWYAQTFTATDYHTVTSVKLLLYREDLPGTITVSLRETSGGHPTGGQYVDLASGTTDGNTLTINTAGEWREIALAPEINLAVGIKYAIVVRAVGGTTTNSVHWRVDATAPTYTGGNVESSTDSGLTWATDDTKDAMFEIWGNYSVNVFNMQVFSSVIEDGDWLVVFQYQANPAPYYPGSSVTQYMEMGLNDDSTSIAKLALPAWGYKPSAIYLSKDYINTKDLIWGTDYEVFVQGINERWNDPDPAYLNILWYNTWVGADLFYLDEWVRDVAQDIEGYYGIDIYTETVGSVVLPAGEGVLTLQGGDIFLKGIPGLDIIRPHLFYVTIHQPTPPTGTKPHTYEETLVWEAQVGPYIADLLNTAGDVVNVEGNVIGGMILFAVYIAIVGFGVVGTRSPAVATGMAIPLLLGGMWLALIPMPLMAILCIAMLFLTVWILFLRGT